MPNTVSVSTQVDSLLPYLDKGGATLLAACVAAGISPLGLIVSFWSARSQARLVSGLSDIIMINKEARDQLKQLTSFYDPNFHVACSE